MRAVAFILLILCPQSFADSPDRRHAEFYLACKGLTSLAFAGQDSRLKELEPLTIDDIELRRRSYQFKKEQIVFLEDCRSEGKQPPTNDDYYGELASVVRGFTSYEVKGRVLAYSFTCFLITTKNGHITERIGASGKVYYIDEDGDGTFERHSGTRPLQNLPHWVK